MREDLERCGVSPEGRGEDLRVTGKEGGLVGSGGWVIGWFGGFGHWWGVVEVNLVEFG